MSDVINELAPFKEICRKICLNIPDSGRWQWDAKRNMAALVLDAEDAELVFFPLLNEFKFQKKFSSAEDGEQPIWDFIDSEYGLMPGQTYFTSHIIGEYVLSVAWWPWGSDNKVSMRVGLIPVNQNRSANETAYQCLSCWLDIAE